MHDGLIPARANDRGYRKRRVRSRTHPDGLIPARANDGDIRKGGGCPLA